MIYPLPEMPLNTQGMKDDGKFFRRKINLAKVLIICDVDSYPNIYELLKVLQTVAVG